MSDNGSMKSFSSVVINLGEAEGRIERLLTQETGLEKIRISCWSQGHLHPGPLDISEKELVTLLYKAIRAGILSPEFLSNLHDEFEI